LEHIPYRPNLDKNDYKSENKLQFGRKKLKSRWNYKSGHERLQIGQEGLQIRAGITNWGKRDQNIV